MMEWAKWMVMSGAMLSVCPAAMAALGAAPEQVEKKLVAQRHAEPARATASGAPYKRQSVAMPDGGVWVEFINMQGLVFAVSWQSPSMPDLRAILGSYMSLHENAQKEARERSRSPGMLNAHVGDWTVVSTGRMRDFKGYSFVSSLMPDQFDKKELNP